MGIGHAGALRGATAHPLLLHSDGMSGSADNDLMATGGDGYPSLYLRDTSRNFMVQLLAAYNTADTPPSLALQARNVCTTSGATAWLVPVP